METVYYVVVLVIRETIRKTSIENLYHKFGLKYLEKKKMVLEKVPFTEHSSTNQLFDIFVAASRTCR